MGVPSEQFHHMLSVLAGILLIGNLTFVTAGGAQVQDKSGTIIIHLVCCCLFTVVVICLLLLLFIVLEKAASLLGLDAFRLGDCLTQKFMKLRGEEITTPLTLEQVTTLTCYT